MRNRHLARLHRMLEMVMTAARADETPSVCFKLADNITQILAHRTPQLRPKVARRGKQRKTAHQGGSHPMVKTKSSRKPTRPLRGEADYEAALDEIGRASCRERGWIWEGGAAGK